MDILKIIMDNASLIIGIIISAVISFILGVITVTQITQNRLQYEIAIRNLISEKVSRTPDLKIQYRDVDVNNFSSAIVTLYNTGYNAIKKADISRNDPIKITINPPNQILYAEIIETSDVGNGLEIINQDSNHIQISFEHLNRKEWAKISLLHTANSEDDIKIEGKIIGGNYLSPMSGWTNPKKFRPILSGLLGVISGTGLSLMFFTTTILFGFTLFIIPILFVLYGVVFNRFFMRQRGKYNQE